MKILHIISQAPDFTGSGKFIREIIAHSNERGYENFLVAGVQADFQMPESLIPEDRCCFVRFDGKDLDFPIPGMSDVMPYKSRVFARLSPADLAAYQNAFQKKIRTALDRFRPDILHTHHLWIVSALVRQLAPGIPMVTSCHGTCLRQHVLCPDISQTLIRDLQQIDHVIALSRDQAGTVIRVIGDGQGEKASAGRSPGRTGSEDRIHVISGGYNEACFYAAPKSFDGVAELVYAGKLSLAKGVPWLLKSLLQIRHLPFRLHIAGSGSGPEKDACLELIDSLEEKVVYHGPLSHEALGDLMRASHVFVLPSFYEGLPLVLMEALACGCRIITTALPGVKEILESDTNDMVRLIDLPPLETIDAPFKKDEALLEKRLADMLETVIRDVARNAEPDLDFIRSRTRPYTWARIFAKIEQVYRKMLKRG